MADRTPAEMRVYIEAAPLPMDGEPIFKRDLPTGMVDGGGYEMAALSLAHGMLALVDEDPSLLNVPSREADPSGSLAADNDALWRAFKKRWPDGSDWLGGPTGFQFGWTHNAVRYVVGAKAVGNPAVITISVPESE